MHWLLALAGAWMFTVAPQEVESRDPALFARDGLVYFNHMLFTGTALERYPNAAPYKRSQYVRGELHGETTEFSLEGRVVAVWRFSHGKKHGLQMGWYAGDGSKRFVAHFKAGLLNGEQIEWHHNGSVFRRQVFVNGVETDKQIFYEGHEIFSNFAKREGRKYGRDGGPLCMESIREGQKEP